MGVRKYQIASQNSIEDRLEQLLTMMDEIERKLSQKADDIVSVQVLQHRNELEELDSRLNEIETRMEILSQIDESELEVVESYSLQKKPWLRRVASLFL